MITRITCIIPMFRTAQVTAKLIDELLRCEVPANVRLSILVVDDDSGDGSAESIEAVAPPCVRVIRNPANLGRSRTRNAGGLLAESEYLLFLDSDCIPADATFLCQHVEALAAGADISVGSITGTGTGFWHHYQERVAKRRTALAQRMGAALAATSPNFMIRREAFLGLGGFDERYLGYGFEDRDFFLRALEAGLATAWTPAATAIHADTIDLSSIFRKMREAGGEPAERFARTHPAAYATLPYAALDATRHRWLRLLRPLTSAVARLLLVIAEPRMESSAWPFGLRALVVRIIVAAAYLEGSATRPPVRTLSSKSA